ncbi:Hypothetical protein ACGLYG10_1160 [Actinomyces glycerinitolerans]|uniref:Uncharacterized protein n=1 Tax=Actinomyces glycerinitolerans TaxID=1892869 RepID=A0A1M4RYC0_9ACTO|nr:Hypothetical protein ACGLYG10_1160 [Actinomyces glycerinitolerans]
MFTPPLCTCTTSGRVPRPWCVLHDHPGVVQHTRGSCSVALARRRGPRRRHVPHPCLLGVGKACSQALVGAPFVQGLDCPHPLGPPACGWTASDALSDGPTEETGPSAGVPVRTGGPPRDTPDRGATLVPVSRDGSARGYAARVAFGRRRSYSAGRGRLRVEEDVFARPGRVVLRLTRTSSGSQGRRRADEDVFDFTGSCSDRRQCRQADENVVGPTRTVSVLRVAVCPGGSVGTHRGRGLTRDDVTRKPQ